MESLAIILYAYSKMVLHEMTIAELNVFQKDVYDYFKKHDPDWMKQLRETRNMDDEMKKRCDEILDQYLKEIIAKRPKEDTDDDDDNKGDANVGKDVLDGATSKKE
jgi:F0F1-type ATP synthase alpha subunit